MTIDGRKVTLPSATPGPNTGPRPRSARVRGQGASVCKLGPPLRDCGAARDLLPGDVHHERGLEPVQELLVSRGEGGRCGVEMQAVLLKWKGQQRVGVSSVSKLSSWSLKNT